MARAHGSAGAGRGSGRADAGRHALGRSVERLAPHWWGHADGRSRRRGGLARRHRAPRSVAALGGGRPRRQERRQGRWLAHVCRSSGVLAVSRGSLPSAGRPPSVVALDHRLARRSDVIRAERFVRTAGQRQRDEPTFRQVRRLGRRAVVRRIGRSWRWSSRSVGTTAHKTGRRSRKRRDVEAKKDAHPCRVGTWWRRGRIELPVQSGSVRDMLRA